jgi:hypothetical protein
VSGQAEVEAVLEPYVGALRQIVLEAWAQWMASDKPARWLMKRSRASFVWEEMIEAAHRLLGSDPRVTIIRKHETFYFVLDGRFAFRFKHCDQDGFTSNYPTQAALDFHDQAEGLSGIPTALKFEVGYVLNPTETAVADIRVVARRGSVVDWQFSILNRGEAATPVTALPIAPTPAAPPVASRKPLVRVKSRAAEEKQSEKS